MRRGQLRRATSWSSRSPHRGARPQINAFVLPSMPTRPTEADEADRRRAAGEDGPLLGSPSRSRTRSTSPATSRSRGPALHRAARRPMPRSSAACAPPARCSSEDDDARAGALAVHRVGDLGRHPQPVGYRPDARRVQRRVGRRGRGRDRAGRARRRRRGLDPHPRRLHRPLRPQAAARPRAPCTARRGRQPLDRLRRARRAPSWTPGSCSTRSPSRRATFTAAARAAAAPRCGSPSPRPSRRGARPPGARRPRRAARHRRVLRGLGHTVVERDVDFGPRDTASSSRCCSAACATSSPRPSARPPRAPQPRLRPPGRARARPDARPAARGRAPLAARVGTTLRRPRRAAHAGHVPAGRRAPG